MSTSDETSQDLHAVPLESQNELKSFDVPANIFKWSRVIDLIASYLNMIIMATSGFDEIYIIDKTSGRKIHVIKKDIGIKKIEASGHLLYVTVDATTYNTIDIFDLEKGFEHIRRIEKVNKFRVYNNNLFYWDVLSHPHFFISEINGKEFNRREYKGNYGNHFALKTGTFICIRDNVAVHDPNTFDKKCIINAYSEKGIIEQIIDIGDTVCMLSSTVNENEWILKCYITSTLKLVREEIIQSIYKPRLYQLENMLMMVRQETENEIVSIELFKFKPHFNKKKVAELTTNIHHVAATTNTKEIIIYADYYIYIIKSF